MNQTPVLEMRNIAKAFGKFYALKGVDLTVFPRRNPRSDGGKRGGQKHADENSCRGIYRHQRRDPD